MTNITTPATVASTIAKEHVLDGKDRVRRRGDTAGEHSRKPVGEVAVRVAGEVAKKITAQITGDAHECRTRDEAGDTPQQIVRGNQRHKKGESLPHM
jgi:hypothetical protein